MPETILRQLEMLEVDKAPGPDELHSSTEMEAACGIANFYRYFFWSVSKDRVVQED